MLCFIALAFGITSSTQATSDNGDKQDAAAVTTSQEKNTEPSEPTDVAAFRQSVGGEITPVIIELRDEPGVVRKAAAEREGRRMQFKEIADYGLQLYARQNDFRSSLAGRGVRALMRETDVRQIDGSVRHIEYRFTYLLNGFVAYVAAEDIARLRALPEVTHVEKIQPMSFHLDKAIDYILGTQPSPAARRTAVYGAAKEVEISGKPFQPQGSPGHPETPQEPNQKIDGFEGQGMNIAVIDTGVDWRHPMFGGTGLTTPTPRVSGRAENAADNRKVIYYYALSSPGDITDDFGHGTHVASCAAGYGVDGSTPRRTGYGTGVNDPVTGLPGTGIGPTPNGVQLFGTAPQARIMAYKVCGPANACTGDSELAMEDAASPFTLVASGDTGPTPVAKPVADVINLSLGDEQGDPTGTSARAANNAALAGTIVVASAGNSGPGAGTTGAPAAATLAISVAASLDPGSTPAGDVLDCQQITGEVYAPNANAVCQTPPPATPGPSPEKGAASNANSPRAGERQGMKLFPVAGGGALPEGSLSAHYVFVDRRGTPPAPVPSSVTNRIAVVYGSGTFASIANPVAALNPAAILIVTAVESATAVVVISGIPTYTIGPDNGSYLINRIREGDSDGADADTFDDVPNGTISQFPMRLADSVSLASFQPGMAGFSSRGPNDFDTRFRTIKPDITAPGVGVTGAATPDGLPDETIGMATPIGYISVNGTSFSGPITAGAIAVVRQRVREELGLDSTTTTAADYRTKRFDTVTVARALLQNAATNLRSGTGVPEGDGASSSASINDMGSGLVNLDGALQAKAIMVAPTTLLADEYTPQPAASPTPMTVLLPTASFGTVPVVGVNATVTRTHQVIIRDLPVSGGDGTYNLTFQNNRLADHPGFQISFLAANGTTPVTSVSVPASGQASFFVKVVADGNLILADPSEFQWYVTATHASTGQALRMPFFYRAVRALIPNITSPNQQQPTGTEQPAPAPSPSCPVDTNGSYTINWTYTKPSGGPNPVGFRVQEATRSTEVFFDNADEPLVAGANSKWAGSAQWTSQVNPDTGSPAYFVPDTAEQNESLTMVGTVVLPPGGASLSFYSLEETEADFDFAHVDIATSNDNFLNFSTIASFSGSFSGTRLLDLSPYAGKTIKVRFRMTSDMLVPAVGWYVEDIRISSDDFNTITDTGPATNSLNITGKSNGTYLYRIAALFNNPNPSEAGTTVTGPFSNLKCVTVQGVAAPATPAISINDATVTEGNSGTTNATFTVTLSAPSASTVTVQYNTANGTATAGSDYQAATGTLTFAPNDTSETITVVVNGDTVFESNETFAVNLSNPTNATIADSQGLGTITNDDAQPPPTISINDVTVTEGNSGTTNATFTVTLSAASASTVTVNFATADNTATAGSDYQAASGTLTFTAGQTTKTITVAVNGDTVVEADETFAVNLSNPTNATISDAQGVGTITNDDQPPPGPQPSLSINDVAVKEGDSGTTNAIFTITLSSVSSSSVTVFYVTSDHTATAGSDYVSNSGSVTFAPGQTSKTVTITVNGDTAIEATESFFVGLHQQTNATIADGQGTGTILNDDPAGVNLDATSYNVSEGAVRFTITITRLESASAGKVDYATSDGAGLNNCDVVNGIASQRCDYNITVGRLRFAAGESSKTIEIPVIDDAHVDGTESFTFTLSNASGMTLGVRSTATLTITDNDSNANAANPIDSTDFFVREHYVDFLDREPEPAGLQGWRTILNNCPQGDTSCDRIQVSSAFYRSPEFQDRAYFVYRFYEGSLERKPNYAEFMFDISFVTGFQTDAEKEASKIAFIDDFMARAEFKNRYDSKTQPRDYVNELEKAARVTLSKKEELIADLEQGRKTRAEVLRAVAESPEVTSKYFIPAFVVMEYFGYLRREPDALFQTWINTFNSDPNNFRQMVNGFMNSPEYRSRFGRP